MSRVTGDPDRLEEFTSTATPAVADTRDAVEDYQQQLSAYQNAGPNDLGRVPTDLSPPILAELDLLHELDQAPEAFAFALRHLDDLDLGPAARAQLGQLDRFDLLAATYLDDPDAPPHVLLDRAADDVDQSWRWPWSDGGGWRNDPTDPAWWATTSIGAAAATVQEVWKTYGVDVRAHYRQGTPIDAHGRWRPGHADRLNRTIGRATTWQRTATWARRLSRFSVVVPGVFQTVEDVSDPSLTAGHRISRAGSAVLFEGGGGALGAAGGAAGGALAGAAIGSVIPVVGTVAGGAIGGVLGGLGGGLLGGEVGGNLRDNATGAIEAVGDGIDSAISKVTDVGGSVKDTVSGWFG